MVWGLAGAGSIVFVMSGGSRALESSLFLANRLWELFGHIQASLTGAGSTVFVVSGRSRALEHYKNACHACWSLQTPFRTTKMHAAAHGAQKHEFYRAKRFRALGRFALQKCRSQLRARKNVCFTNGSQSPNHVFGVYFLDSVR